MVPRYTTYVRSLAYINIDLLVNEMLFIYFSLNLLFVFEEKKVDTGFHIYIPCE